MFRAKLLAILLLTFLGLIALRLFYWQVIEGTNLARAAAEQRSLVRQIPAQRGDILARDGKILAGSEAGYLLFASTVDLKDSPTSVAKKLAKILASAQTEDQVELDLPKGVEIPKVDAVQMERALVSKLATAGSYYVPLAHKLKQKYAEEIVALKIDGLGFDPEPRRLYPEGSLAATTLGFVGSSDSGEPAGYFGLEGFYNGELAGRSGVEKLERDPAGRPILIGTFDILPPQDGRTLTTTIDRYVQLVTERKLREGVEKYGAKKGSAMVMDPKTGDILASVTWPAFDPRRHTLSGEGDYKDGIISDTYEPGSTFKTVTMAAGLDTGVVKPETVCDACGGPFLVQGQSIHTWNNKYFPTGETMIKVLEHSNNVGTAWLATKLGKDKMYQYTKAFGVGEKTGVDLQGEESGVFYNLSSIAPIDLATMGFGQGFSTTALKMLQIMGTVANGGEMMKPRLVSKITEVGKEINIPTESVRQVIKKETAFTLTQMLQSAVENGEARRLIPQGYRVAGKTGTAQVAIAGHYDPTKTVASFVGFAPVEDPKFVMIVKYTEPTTTPFGATTAVPTFMDITKELFGYYGIAPSNP